MSPFNILYHASTKMKATLVSQAREPFQKTISTTHSGSGLRETNHYYFLLIDHRI